MAILARWGFRALHVIYFLATCMISSVIFYLLSPAPRTPGYVDSLFMCISAMTGTGLTTVTESKLNVPQQVMLFCLLLMGHAIPISAVALWFRRETCGDKLRVIASIDGIAYGNQETGSLQLPQWEGKTKVDVAIAPSVDGAHGTPSTSGTAQFTTKASRQEKYASGTMPVTKRVLHQLKTLQKGFRKYLQGSILSPKAQPASVEYKALSILTLTVAIYWITILSIGILVMGSWFQWRRPDVPHADGVAPFWAGAFTATSAFVNCGMTLSSNDLIPLQNEPFPLCFLGILILAGCTLYPCFLRGVLFTARWFLPENSERWQSSRDALDYILICPERVYHMLYPTPHTFFLLGSVIVLNGINWVSFELLATGARDTKAIRALDGLFQSLAIRGGGFAVVDFLKLPQSMMVLYAFMMYISPFPLRIATQSIITMKEAELPKTEKISHSLVAKTRKYGKQISNLARVAFIWDQIRSQFTKDIMCVTVAVFSLTILESDKYEAQPLSFSTFNIIFEVISAYSCIGISVGFPVTGHSFCGELRPASKLILSVMSLIGRHRDLPKAECAGSRVCNSLGWDATSVQKAKMIQLGSIEKDSSMV
ncbi:hypothetical protein N7468_008835 [Penicillium chermesinum]|uniref:Cation transporter n=1 Tax=Penicillium chermesinum TaxID=63820 RepID=A0A9W9NGQ0_9EURO|nr:uncharacterized protein N7468_008835 [Penicillium chermesinum]KAJ5219631.1 hypothetical protein N7468_008835 [Penicillium chermesinum]